MAAFLYSRFLAKPIVDISNVSKRITALDMAWRCDVSRSDEIGTLAANLNEMAGKLDGTMKELQAANEKLQADIEREREQERRRRDFFSAISHELKTPVTILKGELDGMILNVGKFKDRDKYLQEAYETTESIEKLVREIMTLAKLDTISLKPENVKLSDLTDDCLRTYEVLARNKHIKIGSCYEDDATVNVDKGQMRTVLSNIIGNAVKHSPDNGIVDIRASNKNGKVIFTVENSGVHIDPAELGKIWEPFYRTDKSRSRDTGGSGLGLYIVKTILDLHRFEYRLENTDSGMRFTVLFP
jgi:two-component system sensor histidine kinase VanS